MGLKNILFGKKESSSQIQSAGLSKDEQNYNKLVLNNLTRAQQLTKKPLDTAGIKADIVAQQKAERAGFEDQVRGLDQLRASRGLSRSSVGLGARTGASQRMASRLGEIGATFGSRVRALKDQRFNRIMGIGSRGLIGQQSFMGAAPKRGGGLLDVALTAGGAAIGGAYGGPAGAGAGAQMGAGLGQSARGIGG